MTETFVAILANCPNRRYDAADAGEAPILPAMVTISITPTAFEAIAATLPTGYTTEGRPDGKGGYLVTLDRHVVEEARSDAQATRGLQRRDPAAREGLNLDDRNLCRDHRNDGRIVGGLRDSGGHDGRFHSVAGLERERASWNCEAGRSHRLEGVGQHPKPRF